MDREEISSKSFLTIKTSDRALFSEQWLPQPWKCEGKARCLYGRLCGRRGWQGQTKWAPRCFSILIAWSLGVYLGNPGEFQVWLQRTVGVNKHVRGGRGDLESSLSWVWRGVPKASDWWLRTLHILIGNGECLASCSGAGYGETSVWKLCSNLCSKDIEERQREREDSERDSFQAGVILRNFLVIRKFHLPCIMVGGNGNREKGGKIRI